MFDRQNMRVTRWVNGAELPVDSVKRNVGVPDRCLNGGAGSHRSSSVKQRRIADAETFCRVKRSKWADRSGHLLRVCPCLPERMKCGALVVEDVQPLSLLHRRALASPPQCRRQGLSRETLA